MQNIYKHKTQVCVRLENFGLNYFEHIQIRNNEAWIGKLTEYLQEKEKYDRWIAKYGTGDYITVVFHSDYLPAKEMICIAHHLLKLSQICLRDDAGVNPFSSKTWISGLNKMPGICSAGDPESVIQFLHAYVSGFYSSPLFEYCSGKMPFIDLVNNLMYEEYNQISGVVSRFDEIDNNDGVLLVDLTSSKYCFVMTHHSELLGHIHDYQSLPLYIPVATKEYLTAFYPETGLSLVKKGFVHNKVNIKQNKRILRTMKEFKVLTHSDLSSWFPSVKSPFPDTLKYKPAGRTPLKLIDAQEMAKTYPKTFFVIDQEELSEINIGNRVRLSALIPEHIRCQIHKVDSDRITSERFWIEVKSIDGIQITGTIITDVQLIDHNIGDTISCEQRHVYEIR